MLMYRRISALVLMGGMIIRACGATAADGQCDNALALPETAAMVAGMQQTHRFPVAITRVAIGAPEIADVELLDEHQLLLTAKQPGITSLKVWTDCADTPQQLELTVRSAASAEAHGGKPFANESKLRPQVQTDIKVVEVSRQKFREVGSDLFFREGAVNFGLGAPANFVGRVGESLSTGIVGAAGFNILFGGGSRDFLVALNALESSGFAYTLAEPSLVALSGQSANFLAGGEFPVPVRGGITDTVTIEFKEFGVRLALTPTVLSNDRIALRVAPEVSELDFSAGIESGGVAVPALRVRRTETSIELADGESFVISGLISTTSRSEVDRLPGLGQIPILGAFFRNSQLDTEDRELLMVVTPRVVQPLRADARTPDLPGEDFRNYRPGFLDFYLHEDGSFGRDDDFGFSD